MTTTTTAPMAPSDRRRQKSSAVATQRCRASAGSASAMASAGGLMAMALALRSSHATTSVRWLSHLSVPDAGIKPGVHEVHEEVHHDEDGGHEQHQRLGEGVVAVRHGLDEQEPEAVEIEDLLRHHEAAHEEGELDAHHGEHRQHGVLRRVARQDQ